MKSLFWFALVFCLALESLVAAAPDGVTARLAAPVGEITVGDPIILLLTVAHPAGTVVDPPEAATLWGVEPKDEDKPPDSLVVEKVERAPVADPPLAGETSWRIHARLFAPGVAHVPGVRVRYRIEGSADEAEIKEAQSGAISINVGSVLAKPDEPPADIKGMWRLPADWRSILLWTSAILAAVVMAGWMIRRYIAKRRRIEIVAPLHSAVPALSPWERATRDLDALLAKGVPARDGIKEFHVLLSEIVKRFLGEQHGFDALDRTSEEVLANLSEAGVAEDLRESAMVFLVACDLVKFAKAFPDFAAVQITVAQARRIIETGRPPAVSKEEQAA